MSKRDKLIQELEEAIENKNYTLVTKLAKKLSKLESKDDDK